ncbi:MAG: SPASM domain-containing protein [DPANN group archaeon]|nr:SPASM domain-containing protein [DPANN group archaeon]
MRRTKLPKTILSIYNSNVDVQTCPGTNTIGGNLIETSLKDIIQNSQSFKDLRTIDHKTQESCKTCKDTENGRYYGCRKTTL